MKVVDELKMIIITNQQIHIFAWGEGKGGGGCLGELGIRVTISLPVQIHTASLVGHNLHLPAIAGFHPPPLISTPVIDCRLASGSDSMFVTEHLLFYCQIMLLH